jgi:hypothetical protein
VVTGKRSSSPVPVPKTLWLAHELLMKMRPARDAPTADWLRYYRQSAAVYAEVAELDRGHHHEALYWAERERRKATALQAKLARTVDRPVIETVKEKSVNPEADATIHKAQ